MPCRLFPLYQFFLFCVLFILVFFFYVCLVLMTLPPNLQPALCRRRCRSMSVCVPPSSYSLSHAHSPTAAPLKKPSTPPPDLSSSSYPRMPLTTERDTFAGRLSKALETVLPLHSASPQPRARQQRRASLPALFSTPVGFHLNLHQKEQ